MHVAFFTVRMRKGFGVDLCVDKWARGLLDPTLNISESPQGLNRKPFADKVTVFCFDHDGETYKDAPYEIVPLHLTRDKLNKFLPLLERDTVNTLRSLQSELGTTSAFDIALAASFPFYCIKKAFDIPVIHLHFGNPPTFGLTPLARVNRMYLDSSDLKHMARNDRVLSISNYLKNELPQKLQKKTDIVYPGANHLPIVSNEIVQSMCERLQKADNSGVNNLYILSVSRLDYKSHPYKGVIETVDLYNKLRNLGMNIRLVLAGVGSNALQSELRDRGAIVINAPSTEELSGLYLACDIFLSLSCWEGFGLPVAEAGLAGLPTIAFNTTAHAENAVSCKIYNYQDAEKMIITLVNSKQLRIAKGNEARILSQRFSWVKSCKGLLEIIKKLT